MTIDQIIKDVILDNNIYNIQVYACIFHNDILSDIVKKYTFDQLLRIKISYYGHYTDYKIPWLYNLWLLSDKDYLETYWKVISLYIRTRTIKRKCIYP